VGSRRETPLYATAPSFVSSGTPALCRRANLVHGIAAPVGVPRAGARAHREDEARAVARSENRVLRIWRTVDEVPLPQWALLSLDEEQRFARENQEVLLGRLPVVHRHRLTRSEDEEVDPELRVLGLALEIADRTAALSCAPLRLAGAHDEPTFALGDQSVLGLLEAGLGS
jgi:hypothetical protein